MKRSRLAPLLLLGPSLHCKRPAVTDTSDPNGNASYELGSRVECDNPEDSFDRFTENASSRGLDFEPAGWEEMGPCGAAPGGLSATDLDGDGDVDLLFNRIHQAPALYMNEGGSFSVHDLGLSSPGEQPNLSISAVDIDGDGLPELFSTGLGYLAMSANQGDLGFGDWEFILLQANYPKDCFATVAHGDVDGDHDLDLFLPGLDQAESAESIMPVEFEDFQPTMDRLFLNEGGVFTEVLQLEPAEDDPGLSLLAVFTDREGDGDLDILQGADRPWAGLHPPTAFWRSEGSDEDGLPQLVNDAVELGADLYISSMGMGSADLNDDGLLDYCMSDIADQLGCLMSSGDGYYDGAFASGLVIEHQEHPDVPDDWEEEKEDEGRPIWVGWGLAMVDFDADGHVDLAGAAGPTPDYGTVTLSSMHEFQPDWMWRGQPGGTFESVIGSVDFGSTEAHYGIATADLDGDGHREIILGGYEGTPQIWDNPCGSGGWLEVELIGPGENRQGLGSLVRVEAGDAHWMQELHGLVAHGQSPASVHFGLGSVDTVDNLSVTWPDGEESTIDDFAPSRVVKIYHPDAAR